jgi:hypothetical protein
VPAPIEQAEEAPAEIVVRLGRLIGRGLPLEPLIGVEGMLLALEFLLVGQLAAGLDDAILGGMCGASGPVATGAAAAPAPAGAAPAGRGNPPADFAICRPATKPSR